VTAAFVRAAGFVALIGNLYKFTTRDSKLQTFFYDARNRNNQYTWSDGTPTVNKTYYDNEAIHTLSNSNSAITYTYDGLNRIQGEAQNITGLGSESVGYAFNTDNTTNTLTYPDGTVLTYGYDGRNDVKSITQSGVSTAVVGYGYDGNGNRTSKTWGNGVSSILNYDNVERLTSITDSFSTTTLESFNYGYDALSRAKYVKRTNGLGDVFSYDTSDQLTNVEYNATNPDTTPTNPSKTVGYTLDSSGNRKQVVDSVAGTTTYLPFNSSTPANSNNQYTTIGGNAVGYDSRYNLTSYNGTTYTYDAENHLTQLTNGSLTENFYYDPLGRCVATYNSSTSTTTYSVYDLGWNVLADYTAVNALPRMGTAAIAQRYVHGVGTDEIASKTALPANQVVYYQSDGAGNVTQLTNTSGAVIEGYSYDVFGTPTFKNGTGGVISGTQFTNRFLFAGREYLAGVNLYQYRNRAYSPDIGRFLQPDPIGHDGDGYSFYRFCGNDPVNNDDPSGLDPGADFSFFEGGGSDFFSYGTSDSGTTFFSNYSPSFGSTGFSGGSGGSGGNIAIGGLTINQAPQSMVTGEAGMSPSSFGVLDGIQASLTVAGFVPGLGEVTNGASAIISVFQGDWTGAGLSAAALIPFAGDFADAAKLARLGKKGSGAVEEGVKLYRGVPAGTTKYEQALQGLVKPRGSALDQDSLIKHVLGEDVDSGVTSWTKDPAVAARFSGPNGLVLEVPLSNVLDRVVPRPPVGGKYENESEVLLKGIINL
jgi:RHS repeat-associated protein